VVRPSDPLLGLDPPKDLALSAELYHFSNLAGAYFHYASFVALCPEILDVNGALIRLLDGQQSMRVNTDVRSFSFS